MNKAPIHSPLLLSQYSHIPFLLFTAFVTYSSLFIIVWLVRSQNYIDREAWIAGLVATVLRCVGTIFMWIIWLYKTNTNTQRERRALAWFENSYHTLIVLSLALRVGTEVLVGQCSKEYSLSQYMTACNDFQDANSIHPTYLISFMLVPQLAYFLIRETRIECIVLSWLTGGAAIVFCAVHMKSEVLFYTIFNYFFASLSIFYETKRQNDDVVQLVAALQATAEEVERLQEEARATELRAMIGNVAHDLKTPLTSLLSGIECIEETMACLAKEATIPLPEHQTAEHVSAVRACLKSMLGSSSFMTMCINRCLDFTKASKGVKLVPKPETVNLQDALDYPISIMRDVQTQLPITLAPVPAEICSHIITDKQWLMENVLCMVSNAVRYSQAGSVEVRVLFQGGSVKGSVEQAGLASSICIEVWDTGIGLPESVMAALFAPFKQAQRLAGGTGLGLFSLAKRVEALQGQYGVCKRPDKAQGSMFWFSIPYRPDILSAEATPSTESADVLALETSSLVNESKHMKVSPRSNRFYSVLVVDDAPSILKMTSMLLTKKGHTVEKAVNGAQAVDMVLYRAQYYDVVLMDLQMPVMDGPEAIRRIRAFEQMSAKTTGEIGERRRGDIESGDGKGKLEENQERTRSQLIIALSANSDSDTMQEALDAGADYFMCKPFTFETFGDIVRRHMDK